MNPETSIQNSIRLAIAPFGRFFRANAGTGWQGRVVRHTGDSLLLANPRPFHGLPEGFSDLFGVVPVTVTPEMVGRVVGVFAALEVKTETGRVRPGQGDFLAEMRQRGAICGVPRSPEEAVRIIEEGIKK